MNKYYEELYNYSAGLKVIDTHCHHFTQEIIDTLTFQNLIRSSYVGWIFWDFMNTPEGRKELIDAMCTNTYFIWFAKSLGEIYGDGTPLNLDNWDAIEAEFIKRNSEDRNYHIKLLNEKCHYEAIVLDKYENPGSNNGHPEINRPTFRCDSFLFGYGVDKTDNNNNCAYSYFERMPQNIDEYVDMMAQTIENKVKAGCCALKIAIAYERGLDFELVTKEQASKGFQNPNATPEEIKAFSDYIMFRIAEVAAHLNIPIQIHTGLGGLHKANAMQLQPLIHNNKDTKFVLFHCSFPWVDDVLGLAHNYRNVFPDTCWLPLISTSTAERFVSEALEVVDTGRLTWGCDTWSSEESYGALMAGRHVLAKVLSKKIKAGIIDMDQAKNIMENILYKNAKRIYNL